jgi:urease accessory protein
MSPTFPIGSFAYSHGLEQAISDGRVATQDDVQSWISDLLQAGSGWNDAVLFAQCWHGDPNDLALAMAGSHERYSETTQLGRNFNIAASVWIEGTSPALRASSPEGRDLLQPSPSEIAEGSRTTSPSPLGSVPEGRERSLDYTMAYPVAAGRACKRMGIPQDQALAAYLQGFCAGLVSVAVRLVPLGQTAGLRVLRNLAPLISASAQRAALATLEDLGSNCIASEIAAMTHETLEPRIFRT